MATAIATGCTPTQLSPVIRAGGGLEEKTMSEKLKRCPFCGGNAELESSYADYVGSGLHKIVCKVCGCQTNYEHPMQKAIDVWNRRAEK